MPISNKQNQANCKARKKKLGLRRFEYWLTVEHKKKVDKYVKALK